jgi:hypothetical protein
LGAGNHLGRFSNNNEFRNNILLRRDLIHGGFLAQIAAATNREARLNPDQVNFLYAFVSLIEPEEGMGAITATNAATWFNSCR